MRQRASTCKESLRQSVGSNVARQPMVEQESRRHVLCCCKIDEVALSCPVNQAEEEYELLLPVAGGDVAIKRARCSGSE